MVKDFATRLKYFRSVRDLTQAELAKSVGVSGKQISDYEVGTSKPRQSTFIKILNALNINEQVFNNADLCSFDINDLDKDENIIFTNNDGDKIVLPRSFCAKNHLQPINELSIFRIKGDAMSDTLMDGDLVLIDTSDKDVISGLLYLVFLYGQKIVGRLYHYKQGFLISSDNKDFPDSTVADKGDVIILGKVVFRQGLI